MEQQHTPEPWKARGDEIGYVSNDDDQTYGMVLPIGNLFGDNYEANACRIVACVNACAGFSNDELEGANLHKDSIDAQNEIDDLRADLATAEQDSRQKQARIDRLERERDELLSALAQIANDVRNLGSARIIAKAAIASVKGGAE